MSSEMNAFFTGWMMIGLGAISFLPAYVPYRRSGRPFVEKNTMYGYLGVVGAAIMVVGVITIVVSIGMMIAGAGLSVGQVLVVLGLGSAGFGWLLGRYAVPTLRRVTTRLDQEDEREGRWPRISHWMDRAYVQILAVMSPVLQFGGLLLAVVGLVLAVANLSS